MTHFYIDFKYMHIVKNLKFLTPLILPFFLDILRNIFITTSLYDKHLPMTIFSKKHKTVNIIWMLLLVDVVKQFLYGDFALLSIYSELFLAEEKSWHGVRGRKNT